MIEWKQKELSTNEKKIEINFITKKSAGSCRRSASVRALLMMIALLVVLKDLLFPFSAATLMLCLNEQS